MRAVKMRHLARIGLTTCLLLSAECAAAQSDDRAVCMRSGDDAIAACTRLMASGRYKAIDSANVLQQRARAYYEKGEYYRAIADFTEAIRLDPKTAYRYKNRAVAHVMNLDYDPAIADYDTAIQLEPKKAEFVHERGVVFNRKNDYDRAIADFTEAIRLDPKLARAFNSRAAAYHGKAVSERADALYDRALADANEAIRLDPRVADAFNNRGIAYDAKQEYERAITDFTEAIRLDPDHARAFNNRCLAYGSVGRELQRALADCDEALRLAIGRELVGTRLRAFLNRGLVNHKLGRFDQAIDDYDIALRISSKSADALYGRGLAKLRKGDTRGGNADIAAAKAIDGNIVADYARRGIEAPRK